MIKKTFQKFGFILSLGFALAMFSCTSAPKSDNAEVGEAKEVDEKKKEEAKKMSLDLEKSIITWVGTKPTERHNGTFNIAKGEINIKDGAVVGGEFTIDLETLKVLDGSEDSQAKLRGHLLSADFFGSKENPNATFVITSVEPFKETAEETEARKKENEEFFLKDPTHKVNGNFTINGIEKGISFPAKITVGDKVTAEAKFNINRKDWNMNYNSDKSLGDKFIRHAVHIGFNIETK